QHCFALCFPRHGYILVFMPFILIKVVNNHLGYFVNNHTGLYSTAQSSLFYIVRISRRLLVFQQIGPLGRSNLKTFASPPFALLTDPLQRRWLLRFGADTDFPWQLGV